MPIGVAVAAWAGATATTTISAAVVAGAVNGLVAGAIIGAASAAVTGGDIVKGALTGAFVGGVTGGALAWASAPSAAASTAGTTAVEATAATSADVGANAMATGASEVASGTSTAGTTGLIEGMKIMPQVAPIVPSAGAGGASVDVAKIVAQGQAAQSVANAAALKTSAYMGLAQGVGTGVVGMATAEKSARARSDEAEKLAALEADKYSNGIGKTTPRENFSFNLPENWITATSSPLVKYQAKLPGLLATPAGGKA